MVIKAGFLSSSPGWHWERQFPDDIPTCDDVEFVFSGDFRECDILFVFDAIPLETVERAQCRRSVFIASEPPSIKIYDPGFLRQFDAVLTTDSETTHPNCRLGQIGSPWHIGAWDSQGQLLSIPMNYRGFQSFDPVKTKSISVVSSNKARTEGHRARLEFVERLKTYFGSEIDVYGRNINGFGDKTEVLNEYRYHIAIENSCYANYWTEKIADPFLSLTYPIYHGCPNINDYFPPDSLTPISISDPDNAIITIRKLIDSDRAEAARSELEESRRRVLTENNLFHLLARLAADVIGKEPHETQLEPEKYFTHWKYRMKSRAKRSFRYVSRSALNRR